MAVVLGLNAVFHDPASALVVDGQTVAAAEEERFSRVKHGKEAVPFSTWELPFRSASWCLSQAGLQPGDVDAITYSYDPSLMPPVGPDITCGEWEPLRTLYADQAPSFLESYLPGVDGSRMRYVRHHVAHAASAYLAAPFPDSSVLVIDGRGETTSHLAGRVRGGDLEILHAQALPHSLGLMYEELTMHLGFARSSDEYKVMAMASYGAPAHLDRMRELIRTDGGGFTISPIPWSDLAPKRMPGGPWDRVHADLAASVQHRLQEVLLDLASWLHGQTGDSHLTMAGGVALNCVANSFLHRHGPFDHVWVQPAAGDAGTALGGAMYVARQLGDPVAPMDSAALGRSWTAQELEGWLLEAAVPYERPADLSGAVADVLANEGVVAWFQGRSEYGPRALGHRSLLASPRRRETLHRLNTVKGREQFRPVAPVVTIERAATVFDGPFPSPYMLFTHQVRPEWKDRVAAAVHVDGSARVQSVDQRSEPLLHDLLSAFERRTGTPVLINTSLNTAGRPMVDDPRDALECLGSAPVDLLVLGPFLVRRSTSRAAAKAADQVEHPDLKVAG